MLRPYLTVNSSKGLLSTYLHHAARMVFPQYTYEINAPNTPIFLVRDLGWSSLLPRPCTLGQVYTRLASSAKR